MATLQGVIQTSFFTKSSFYFSAVLKIYELDIPRITCAMPAMQALLIHSSCVYTGEIAS